MARAVVTEYCMKINIAEISKLNFVWSPEILIHGVPWKVKICKVEEEDQQWLGAYLYCANKDKSPNWALSGLASFKLLPFSDKMEPVEYHTPTFVFDRSGTGYGESTFILWDELFDEAVSYVKNDTIKLEVNVMVEDPNDPNRSRLNFKCISKCCVNSRLATYRITVHNITNLMAVRSSKFKLRGLMWEVHISKQQNSYLGVLLKLVEDSKNMSCKMKMSIKLVSSKKDVDPIERCNTEQYQPSTINIVRVIFWNNLMKPENGFVNNGSITLEIELKSDGLEGDVANVMNDAKSNPENEANFKRMKCAICLEYIDSQDLACTPCGHLFCFECIKKAATDRAACPACTEPVHLNILRRLYLPL